MQMTATIHQAIGRGLADCHLMVVVYSYHVYIWNVLVDRGVEVYIYS